MILNTFFKFTSTILSNPRILASPILSRSGFPSWLVNIPRCVAINLKPKTDDNSLNLLNSLKKTYNHFDMGVYLTALDDGKINVGDKIELI